MKKDRDGGYYETEPLPGEAGLDELSALADLVKPFSLSDVSAQVAAGATVACVASRIGRGREALLVAFAFDFGSEDYKQSPWALRLCARGEDDTIHGFASGDLLLGPYKTAVGSLTQPFIMPYPARIPKDKQVAIVVKNNAAAPYDAQGFLYGISWDYESNRDVRRALFGKTGKDIWPVLMFGGGK